MRYNKCFEYLIAKACGIYSLFSYKITLSILNQFKNTVSETIFQSV